MTARWSRSGGAVGAIAMVLVLVAAACGGSGSDEDGASGGPAAPSGQAGQPGRTPPRAAPARGIRPVKVTELDAPVGMATRRGDPALYLIEQSGRVRALRDGRLAARPVVDLRGEVSTGSEQGLLGIAFSPDGRFLYLDHTDRDGHTHVTEWSVAADGTVDQDSRRRVLFQRQPFANHNGGQLAFGPDGHLYIALGDGGSAGDPRGNAQNLGTWLGKILRISPRPAGGRAYGVPPDNPFVRRPGARPEIWAYGLRNPWRFSFDARTGDLWIGDVGQNAWEEVNRQPAGSDGGENYGWNPREGRHRFRGDAPRGAVEPVLEFPLGRDDNCSVIGGHVYRGSRNAALAGRYVFADFCGGWVDAAAVSGDDVGTPRRLLRDLGQPSSFGADQSGELYLLTLDGPVYRLEPG